MKNQPSTLVAALLILTGLLAGRPADILTDTGVTLENIRAGVLENLSDGTQFLFRSTAVMRKTARAIPEGTRAAAVRLLGKVVRAYVESDEFRQTYRESLKAKYPVDETYNDARIAQREQELQGSDETIRQQLGAVQQAYAQLDPAMLQAAIQMLVREQEAELGTLEGTERAERSRELTDLKKMLAATEGKPAEFKKQFLAYQNRQLQQNARTNVGQAEKDLSYARERNAEYRRQKALLDAHADFRPVLRERLRAFVALSESVDFSAALVTSRGKQEFVNPAYQRKPAEWKFLYRLGREPVGEARAFAQVWLADLK